MAKQEREIERWITVHGKRVPIYKDGGMGGFMEGKKSYPKDADVTKEKEREEKIRALKEAKAKEEGFSSVEAMEEYEREDAESDKVSHKETLKQTDKIARAMAKNKMSEEDMQELIDEHDGDVDKALRSLEGAEKIVAKEKERAKLVPADADTKRAAQAEVLKDYGIDRDAALEAIKARTGKSGEEAEKLMDNMDVVKIKKLAEEDTRNMPARSQEQIGKYDKYKQGFYYDRAKEVNVNGHTYKVWSDQNYKGTFAEDENGNVLPISGSGYLSNELSQRKAIANKFGEPSFRSKSIKVGDKEVGVTKKPGTHIVNGYEITKRTGYEWVRPTNGSRISTKQRKRTGYSAAGKTFNTLAEAKAYVEQLPKR